MPSVGIVTGIGVLGVVGIVTVGIVTVVGARVIGARVVARRVVVLVRGAARTGRRDLGRGGDRGCDNGRRLGVACWLDGGCLLIVIKPGIAGGPVVVRVTSARVGRA